MLLETSIVMEDRKNESEAERNDSRLGWIGFIFCLVIAFIVFRYVIGFIVISGDSMNPTLENGNVVLSSNLFYTVDRHDIIIYRDHNGFDVVKRVIGLPNDRIMIQDGSIVVNGEMMNEPYRVGASNDMEEVVVPKNTYFVVGDNRTPGESLDSRSINVGPIHKSTIQGEVWISLFPFSMALHK